MAAKPMPGKGGAAEGMGPDGKPKPGSPADKKKKLLIMGAVGAAGIGALFLLHGSGSSSSGSSTGTSGTDTGTATPYLYGGGYSAGSGEDGTNAQLLDDLARIVAAEHPPSTPTKKSHHHHKKTIGPRKHKTRHKRTRGSGGGRQHRQTRQHRQRQRRR